MIICVIKQNSRARTLTIYIKKNLTLYKYNDRKNTYVKRAVVQTKKLRKQCIEITMN